MFIAEIGINHKGNEKKAMEMLKRAVNTKADAVTFQIPKPDYYEGVNKWGGPLSKEFYKEAIDYAHSKNKQIGFAIGDKDLIPFLNLSGTDFWKSLSIYIKDVDLKREFNKTGKTVYVSTGVSDEEEILRISEEFTNIKLIHTQLSPDIEEANLKAINRLREVTNKEIAFGLHCADHYILYLSVAFDPSDIFFYVKDNSGEEFPDDKWAIDFEEVDEIIEKMQFLKKGLGSGIKKEMESKLE